MQNQAVSARPTSRTVSCLTPSEVYTTLTTTPQGLSSEEADQRSARQGLNDYVPRRQRRRLFHPLRIAVRQLLLPLWVAAGLFYALDRIETALAVFAAAVLNTAVAVIQENKREQAALRLREDLPTYARVLRDGNEHLVPLSQVVIGDVLPLVSGDILPADARVIEANDLQLTNHALFGDAAPFRPFADGILPEELKTDSPPNVAYAGSRVVGGNGKAVVFATGLGTAYGSLATMTETAHEEPSPLMLVFSRLGRLVLILGIAVSIFGWFIAQAAGLATQDRLVGIALLLVAVVPAGLMPGVTLVLYAGLRQLHKVGAGVRRLSSVETLGATTMICADKTGTLTQNEQTVREVWTADGSFTLGGVGYLPQGQVMLDQQPLEQAQAQQYLGGLLRAAVLTTTARLLAPDTLQPRWHILGDPCEAAQLVAAKKIGLDPSAVYNEIVDSALLASGAGTPLEGVIVSDAQGPRAIIHGSPHYVLPCCTAIATSAGTRPLTEQDQQLIKSAVQRAQRNAMQTFAFAERRLSADAAYSVPRTTEVAHDMVLLGMLLILDPPRSDVEEAIQTVRKAGIRTVMLTGDDVFSAESMARRCGLTNTDESTTLTGLEIRDYDDAKLLKALHSGELVLAQLSPDQKLKIVEMLDSHGDVVMVTGAAANDVPAIKAADIGLALGQSGSPAAREAADVVLEDDNFATLSAAITIGRNVEQRVRRLTAINLGATMLKLAALILTLIFQLPLFLTVGQLLLIDLLAGLIPAVAFGFSPINPRLMQRKPRPTGRPLIDNRVYRLGYVWFGGLAFVPALLVVIATMFWMPSTINIPLRQQFQGILEPGQPTASAYGSLITTLYVSVGLAALIGAGLVLRSGKHLLRRQRAVVYTITIGVLALILSLVSIPVLQPFLHFTPLPWWGWLGAFSMLVAAVLVERGRQAIDQTPER